MKLIYSNSIIFLLTRKIGFILLFITLFNSLSLSQDTDKSSAKSGEKNFSEELYIKTDRDLYIAGEKVWLKIYKLNGLTHTPGNLSKVVYVDLLNIDNDPVIQLKVDVDGNSGSTGFRLPDTIRTGNYILRSYTNWMQNFSRDLFSYKCISVINPFADITDTKILSASPSPDSVIFYPEGGHLITGIETKLGFRCFDKNGNPVILSGALISENNDTICNVQTDNNGYGWSSIKPSDQNRIFFVATNISGPVKKFSLPEILNKGITFSVTEKEDNSPALVKINLSRDFLSDGRKLYLKIQAASLTYFDKEIFIGRDNEIDLLRKDLPVGLSHLMIIDDNENLLTDRWIYNENDQLISYNINIQNNEFSTRDKLKIDITATNNKGLPVESDISISIAKAFTINKNSFNNNNKYRQLPEFATITTDTYLPDINDYLIFYSSRDLILNKDGDYFNDIPAYLPELEGHLISGNIKVRNTGEPLKNENITLSFVGKAALCQFAMTDELGNFNFVTNEHGLREIVIQPLSSEIGGCYVELDNPFNTSFNNYNHRSYYIDSTKVGDINNAIISMQINNIYEPYSQLSLESQDVKTKPDFYGPPDKTILMSKYIELTSLKEVVKELMPGVYANKKDDKINFKLINKYPNQPFENNPLVLVDGVPIYDLEQILNINSGEIEKIDVINSRYFITDIVLEGILNFVSKSGDLGVIDFDRFVFRQEYELLQNRNRFYSPDYSQELIKNNRIPDFRNTLYWNPDLHTDKTGKTTIEFYTSDEPGEYIIIVEGITPNGTKGVSSKPLIVSR